VIAAVPRWKAWGPRLVLASSGRLQCVYRRAGQAPGHARGRVLKVDLAVHAALGHLLHNDRAKPALLRCRHGRSVALAPVHGERIAGSPPTDIDATPICRECTIFRGIGGELMEREPDGLCGSRVQAQLGTLHGDTKTNEVGKKRELGAGQIPDFDPMPFAPDEQVLMGCKRPNALGDALDVIFGTISDGPVNNSIHYAEHVSSAMVDLALTLARTNPPVLNLADPLSAQV
jgi:hypothetical protein